MMGIAPGDAVRLFSRLHPSPVAFGANCGNGPAELVASLLGLVKASVAGRDVIVAKGNCGIPRFNDGKLEFTGTPELMAAYARLARDAGARIIGACCGSEPAHLKAMAAALKDYSPGPPPDIATIEERLGALGAGAKKSTESGGAPAQPREARRRRRG
jgi:5-methyltetrahydrofolate--homocysteine methyltransferase